MTTVQTRPTGQRSRLRVLLMLLRRLAHDGSRLARYSWWLTRKLRLPASLPQSAARLAAGGAAQFRRLPGSLPQLPGRPRPRPWAALPGRAVRGWSVPGRTVPGRSWRGLRGLGGALRSSRDRRAARAGQGEQEPRPRRRRTPWPVRIAASAAWLLAGLVLFSCYLHLSSTVPVNSDGASNVLQAWDMLHGNPLLRGWVLSDVSFYTTELPQYMLIELTRGLTPEVVHVGAAMTYAILVLLAARLAKGAARGTLGLLRAGVAAGIMVAPPQSSAHVLLLEPDHIGSVVPVLLVLLLLDRAGRRWFVPPLVFLLLGWALVGDQIVLITGVGPVILVSLARAYQAVVRQRARARTAWFDSALAAAAVAAAIAAKHAVAMIQADGGFRAWPVSSVLAPFAQLPHNLTQVAQGLLVLFGAEFPGQRIGFGAAVGMLHLLGIGLAGWAVCAALRRFARSPLVVQILAVAILASLVAYLLGPNAGQPDSSREFAAVLPLGAALAGRLLARRLRQARLVPALSVVLAAYLAAVTGVLARPAVPAQNQGLAGWLAAHRLDYGLADYWLANSVTADSAGAVAVRAIKVGHVVRPYLWEAEPGWYSPLSHTANFVVLPSSGPGPWNLAPSATEVVGAFGQPARVYFLADYTILVWNSNLLGRLATTPPG